MTRPQAPLRSAILCFLMALAGALACTHAAAQAPREYQLAAGDSIRIFVFQNPDLTTETRVTESGAITFPILGRVTVGGLTIPAAEELIASALRAQKVIESPQVNIVLLQNRGNQVSVLGAVNRPGRFPLETFNTRLSEMLAMAGGVAPGGADVAIVTGMREGRRIRREVDIPALFLEQREADDLVVAGGDVIYVHTRPVFYIYGEVQKPGPYRIERGMTIRQALAAGGGPTPRGTESGLCLYRQESRGPVDCRTPDMDAALRNGDVLYVRESLF